MKKIFIFVAVPFFIFSLASANAAEFSVSNATEFQNALNAAAQNGQDDTINVTAGTLNLTNRLEYLTWENRTLTIQGAAAGTTILNGGGLTQIFYSDTFNLSGADNSAHVTIRGMTLTNGNATSIGGGLNIFTDNANIILENCIFTNNMAWSGGGTDLETIGGTIILTNNSFTNNSSDSDGAGAYIRSDGVVSLTNNAFTGNYIFEGISVGYGGGLTFYSENTGSLSLNRNRFVNNSNSDPNGVSGGADITAQSVTLINNVFSGNIAVDSAGGVYLYVSGELNIINNTIVNNQAENSGGGVYFQTPGNTSVVNAYNNILWGNTAGSGGDFYSMDDAPSLTINYFNNDVGNYYSYCDVASTCTTTINSGNNISSAPQLTADFHLLKGSPCINTGDNNAPNLPLVDFEGNIRKIGGIADIGADEYQPYNIVDFNGDSKRDILWRNPSTGQNAVWYMNGTAVSGFVLLDSVSDPNWKIVGADDFNNDSKTDILWRNPSTGQNAVWYMNGTAVTGFVLLDSVSDANWEIVGTGDFNNDSKPDILWRNLTTGQNAVWYMNGITVAGFVLLDSVSDTNWKIVGTGDFNNDGKPDILWRNPTTGQNAVWHMNGITVAGFVLLDSVSDANWRIVGTGDFNNDRKTDILWRNPATGQNLVWYLNGTAVIGTVLLDSVNDPNWEIVGR